MHLLHKNVSVMEEGLDIYVLVESAMHTMGNTVFVCIYYEIYFLMLRYKLYLSLRIYLTSIDGCCTLIYQNICNSYKVF